MVLKTVTNMIICKLDGQKLKISLGNHFSSESAHPNCIKQSSSPLLPQNAPITYLGLFFRSPTRLFGAKKFTLLFLRCHNDSIWLQRVPSGSYIVLFVDKSDCTPQLTFGVINLHVITHFFYKIPTKFFDNTD